MNNMCKKRVNYFEMLLGVITLVFGILIEARLQITGETQTPNISRFAGMLTGFGCGILIVGVVRLLRNRFSSKEKLKEREIEKNDERNIQLTRAAYTVAAMGALFLFVILAFVYILLGAYLESWLAIGAMYIEVIIFGIAYRVIGKKM
ncbi:MAG: hypothetical protein OSJ74_11595 [Clostridia bacterium]|nr:hypothetical protein [Clostridia bacterium]